MFALLAPLLVLTIAFGIDVTGWYRDAQHLQGLADRVAASAGPLWRAGEHDAALAVAQALVGRDGQATALDHAGAVSQGAWSGNADAFEIVLSSNQQHLLAGLFAPSRQGARAVALDARLVE
jgi:hypothetical protein